MRARPVAAASARCAALAGALSAALLAVPAAAQTRETALEAWQTGKYDEAISQYQALAARPGALPDVHRDLVRVLLEVGRTDEAEKHVRDAGAGPQLSNVLGEVLLETGKWDAAEAAFRGAVTGNASDATVARANLGELLWDRGRQAEALRLFDSFIDVYNAGGARTAADLIAVGRAVRRLGATNPQLFQDALLAFDQAAKAAPGDPRPRVLAGELFLEKYNATEAHGSFKEALQRNPKYPPALVAEARALDFDGAAGGAERVGAALETNPRYAPAHTLRAAMALEAEDFSTSVKEAEAALAIDPGSLEALAVLGAARYLSGDRAGFEATQSRALAINPADAPFYETVANMAVQHRRYAEAVAMAQRGVALDSLAWGTRGLLGMNQLRIAQITEGRANIERAFKGDPYNVWFKNTLDLLDTFSKYRTVKTEHFELFLRQDEADLLEPYVKSLSEEAFAALRQRYGTEPPTPIRLELFPRDADFSVRTLGLTGLGALGVTFGKVIVMDSPAAHEAGDFNWGSTLWHELSHAFHVGMTNSLVPRWFTEGLAVHEQRSGRPGWGHQVSIDFLDAYRAGRLPPASDLNRGFMRPDYPQEVIHSYFLASLVFAWMEETHGKDAAIRMLRGYAQGKSTETLVKEVLGLDLAGFDKAVDTYVRNRYADAFRSTLPLDDRPPSDAPLAVIQAAARQHPGYFPLRLRLGQMLVEAGRTAEAEPELREAFKLFPTYAEVDGPLLYLARIHRERGELDKAAAALNQLGNLNESAYEVHMLESDVRRQMGDLSGAAQALERAILVNPYDMALHQKLADLDTSLKKQEDAVRERRAVVALNPVDKADAQYKLARALLDAGHRDEARREVIKALEVAPNYEQAQDLLLELRGGRRMMRAAGALALAGALTLAAGAAAGSRAHAAEAPPLVRPPLPDPNPPYDGRFAFVRLRYQPHDTGLNGVFLGGRRRNDPMWSHDVPRADVNFLRIMQELTSVATAPDSRLILDADDPELFDYPVAYIVEVGFWVPTDKEVQALRAWLLKGGFLIVDDFRGDHWRNFEAQMTRILPEVRFHPLQGHEAIFDSFFHIKDPYSLVPPYEQELAPVYLGVYEDNDPSKRMMVIANYNQDIAEYWEFSDYGYYPIDLSNDAYKFGVNYVIYGLTH